MADTEDYPQHPLSVNHNPATQGLCGLPFSLPESEIYKDRAIRPGDSPPGPIGAAEGLEAGALALAIGSSTYAFTSMLVAEIAAGRLHKPEQALTLIRRAVALEPDNPEFQVALRPIERTAAKP